MVTLGFVQDCVVFKLERQQTLLSVAFNKKLKYSKLIFRQSYISDKCKERIIDRVFEGRIPPKTSLRFLNTYFPRV